MKSLVELLFNDMPPKLCTGKSYKTLEKKEEITNELRKEENTRYYFNRSEKQKEKREKYRLYQQ